MTDRLTPAMRVEVLELIWNYRSTPGNTLVRYIAELRDEAARREAKQEGSLERPACGGSGHIDDFKARREAEGGIPDDHLKHALDTMPEAARGFAKLAASLSDAPPPPAPHSRKEATMDEKSNEELIEDLIDAVIYREESSGNVYSQVAERQKQEARAAVLARMCGPGEVVVPKEPTHDMLSAWTFTKDYGEHKTLMRAAYANMLAARPNNGGNDDQGK